MFLANCNVSSNKYSFVCTDMHVHIIDLYPDQVGIVDCNISMQLLRNSVWIWER